MRDAGRRRVRDRAVVPPVAERLDELRVDELRVVELRPVELRPAADSADAAFAVSVPPRERAGAFAGVAGGFARVVAGFAVAFVVVPDDADRAFRAAAGVVFGFRAVVVLRVEAALALRVEVDLAVPARAGPPPAARSLLDVRRAGAPLVSSWRRVDAPARLSVGSAGPPVMLPAW